MYAQTLGEARENFWKAFGRYMSPVPSTSGEKINWVNYKTGVKSIRFIMELHADKAIVAVVVSDAELFSNSFVTLKKIFFSKMTKDWVWESGRIYTTLLNVNVQEQGDWPALIAFFKEKIIALDSFWEEVKDTF